MPAAIILGLTLAAGCALVLWQRSRSDASADPASVGDLSSSSPPGPGPDTSAIMSIATSSDPVDAAAQFLTVSSSTPAPFASVALADQANAMKDYTPPAGAAPYLDTIRAVEMKYSLPQNLLVRQLQAESGFRPDVISGAVKSSTGATGIAQFMPATAQDLGVDPLNPAAAIDAAGRYMKSLFNQAGSWTAALAAYNWGIGNVLKHGTANLPAETKNYVATITADVPVT